MSTDLWNQSDRRSQSLFTETKTEVAMFIRLSTFEIWTGFYFSRFSMRKIPKYSYYIKDILNEPEPSCTDEPDDRLVCFFTDWFFNRIQTYYAGRHFSEILKITHWRKIIIFSPFCSLMRHIYDIKNIVSSCSDPFMQVLLFWSDLFNWNELSIDWNEN